MVLTPSKMVGLGSQAADFELPDTLGKVWTLAEFADKKALLVMFICNHCPYVIQLKPAIAQFARDYIDRDLGIIAINANDWKLYPQDSPAQMAAEVEQFGYAFPYVFDEGQQVARAYNAACTPDFFLYDQQRKLVYRGQFDASRPANDEKITGKDLREAADRTLQGLEPDAEQQPSIGCNIKWKA